MLAQRRGETTTTATEAVVRAGIVDDHPLFRAGLREALHQQSGLPVLWDVASAEEALRRLGHAPVDVVLMDVSLKGKLDGIAATLEIQRTYPRVKVIMMSALIDERVLVAALRARAAGFLAKDLTPEAFVRSVRSLVNPSGSPPFQMVHNLLDRFRRPSRLDRDTAATPRILTPREAEVAAHIRDGRTNREIAIRLGISRPTVDKHVAQILRKLEARNRAQAVDVISHRRSD